MTPVRRFCSKIAPLMILLLAAFPMPATAAISEFKNGAVSPSQWPRPFDQGPSLQGWPNALRIWGPDRYDTSLATALTMRGLGGFPYDSPDPSSSGATVLGKSGSWWGLRTCPRSIIVVAGDSPADALAATALSDPTDESTEPYLRRSAAADPLFDPVGGYNRVDTHGAAILLTKSARDGSFGLSTAARIAAKDMRSGGCSTARQAIVVGGVAAVPAAVDEELVALGFSEVFRVEGLNRYQTAAKVALSLGTAGVPGGTNECHEDRIDNADPETGFYANSVVEWRSSPESCRLLGHTVVLTDGIVGADAIAAGWWTSYWQVPVLLHNGRDRLPIATREALQSLGIQNLIVLGGNQRISSAIAQEASELSGATLWRIAGTDRYETSVEMAQTLGGWWPSNNASDVAGSMICVAASDRSGLKALGWPDALSAGPWCGAASRNNAYSMAPNRSIEPVNGSWPALTGSTSYSGPMATPIILVPSGAKELPASIAQFLNGVYRSGNDWCSANSAISGCSVPGFAVVFGGHSAITDEMIGAISAHMDGSTHLSPLAPPAAPRKDFVTRLSMAPVYHQIGQGDVALCARRDAIVDSRWLAAGVDQSERVIWNADLLTNGWYLVDADGIGRSKGLVSNGCLRVESSQGSSHWLRLVNSHGWASNEIRYELSQDNWVFLDGSIELDVSMISSGIDSGSDPSSGGETSLQMDSGTTFRQLTRNGETSSIVSATLSFTLQRGVDGLTPAPDKFTAEWTINTHLGSITGSAEGEAILKDGVWALRGVTSIGGGTWDGKTGQGGFSVDLEVKKEGHFDDTAKWQIDARSS